MKKLRLASWNIRNLEHNNKSRRYDRILTMISGVDICAVQEILDASVVTRITPPGYSHTICKVAVGGEKRMEYYAYIYKNAAVKLLRSQLYADTRSAYRRRPYAAQFKSAHTGELFTLLTIHILYGKGKSHRRPEVVYLGTVATQLAAHGNVVLLGDFNLPPSDRGWDKLKRLGYTALFTAPQKTTIMDVSLLDNIWMRTDGTRKQYIRAGIVKFDQMSWYKDASRAVIQREMSDHRMVWVDIALRGVSDQCGVCEEVSMGNTCSRCATPICGDACFVDHSCA